jgi:NADH-quinone oxidoreductase subunit G
MCIDICPVGALTSGSYRHQARPWELHYVPTICTHCGDGCKTTLSVRNNRVLRGNNRDQSGINGEFLCIKGRYAFDFLHHPERLTQPLVRQEGKLAPATWAEALRAVAARFRQLLEQRSGFGVIGSNHAGNETAYLLQKFARAGLRTNNIDHHRTADYAALIAALARSGVRPADRLAASRDLLTARAVLLIGNNPTEQHPLLAWNMRTNVRLNKGRLYVVNHRAIKLERQATATLRIEEGRAGALLDFLAGQTTAGQPPALQPWNEFRDRLRAESDLLVVFGDEIKGDGIARLVAFGNTLGGVTRYIALGDYNNSRGASDMGLLPGSLPGYAPVEDAVVRARFEAEWNVTLPPGPGLALDEMIAAAGEGRLGALYVVGANPLKRYNLNAASSFLVVQDMFLTETARQADVVLPAAAVYEVNGTVTNTCGELQRIRQALGTNGPRADLEIIGLIAKETGISLGPVGSEEVFDEIRRLVNGYNVAMAGLAAGEAVPTAPADGRDASLGRPDLVHSSGDTLFTSGTLGQYSDMLEAVRRH